MLRIKDKDLKAGIRMINAFKVRTQPSDDKPKLVIRCKMGRMLSINTNNAARTPQFCEDNIKDDRRKNRNLSNEIAVFSCLPEQKDYDI